MEFRQEPVESYYNIGEKIGRYERTSWSYGFELKSKIVYCIVLYLYIYIALLAVHTNQKRFQCERPREKRAVLREGKEALGSPVNKVDRVEGRSWFQSEGQTIANARVWAIEVLARGTKRSWRSSERIVADEEIQYNTIEIILYILYMISCAHQVRFCALLSYKIIRWDSAWHGILASLIEAWAQR